MAAEEVKGMERMLGGRKRQKREVKETRVDRWLSLPPTTPMSGKRHEGLWRSSISQITHTRMTPMSFRVT